MSVLKRNRKESPFKVIDFFYDLRKYITETLLIDFAYDPLKNLEKINKRFGNKPYEQMSDNEKEKYDRYIEKNKTLSNWYIGEERKAILDTLRNIQTHIFMANGLYPTNLVELQERRKHQSIAISLCHALQQELYYVIETLPVNKNKFIFPNDMIVEEIKLIKGWRKSDNKHAKQFENNDNDKNK